MKEKLDTLNPLQTFAHNKMTWVRSRTPQQLGKKDGFLCMNLNGLYPGGCVWIDKNTLVNPGPRLSWQEVPSDL